MNIIICKSLLKTTTTMDALSVFVQYCATSGSILTIQDVAVLHCLSHNVNDMVKMYIDDVKGVRKTILDNTASTLGLAYKEEHVVDIEMLIKHILMIQRLYGDKRQKQKFLQALDNFTRHIVSNIWTEPLAMLSTKKQRGTMYLLMRGVNQDTPEQNIIIVYVLMCFIYKFINSNKIIIHDKDTCLFAHSKIKRIIIEKCIELSSSLREDISCYPFMFIDRVIRRIGDVKRLVSSLS